MPTVRPQAILGVKPSNYAGVAALATLVVASLTGNATYPAPSPALADITTETDTLNDLIADWGPVGNRGSHATLLALRAQSQLVFSMLIAEAAYVQNVAQLAFGNDYPAMAASIATTGFGVKNNPNPQGVLGVPTDFRQVFANNVNPYHVKLDWLKPVGLNSPANVKSYEVLRALTNDFNDASVIGTPTKTTYTDVTALASTKYYYWVRGINTAGPGAQTASIEVNTPVA